MPADREASMSVVWTRTKGPGVLPVETAELAPGVKAFVRLDGLEWAWSVVRDDVQTVHFGRDETLAGAKAAAERAGDGGEHE